MTHKPPQNYFENLARVTELSQEIWKRGTELWQQQEKAPYLSDMAESFYTMLRQAMLHPDAFAEKQLSLYRDYIKIWNNMVQQSLGEKSSPVISPEPHDKRFRDKAWDQHTGFNFMKQCYLATQQWTHHLIQDMPGVDSRTQEKLEFYLQHYLNAMSPSNFVLTNPEVLKATIETKGQNLVAGMQNLLADLKNSKQFLQVKTTREEVFHLGKNIATCKGKVIYQNALMQLIQYTPLQEQNYTRPLLLIPAWINKYYILDLSPENSFVKWLLEQGFTVFVISWVNPGKELAHTHFEDYMEHGPLAALSAIEKATGEREVTALGYCLGGTLLACTLAYMQAKGDNRIKAATFLATLLDFSDAGYLGVFVDENTVRAVSEHVHKLGYLEGSEMAAVFSVIRANDLIWSFVVNNYLLGREPFPFDILYWNSDATRLPASMHTYYLEQMYMNNALVEPGGIILKGIPVDLRSVSVPAYVLATREDHITPWQSAYTATQLFKGDTRFVLSGSGHVAGVVNPVGKNKYCYWTNPSVAEKPDQWFSGAKEQPGSWWSDWLVWGKEHSGGKKPAPVLGSGIEDAPGSYVKVK